MTFIKKLNKIYILVAAVIMLSSLSVEAQYQNKWLSAGMLHNWYSEIGSEIEHGFIASQQYGKQWPAIYRYQDMQAAKAMWIGCRNFQEVDGTTFDYKVVHVGPRVTGVDEFFPIEFKLYSKFPEPKVYVNGLESFGKAVEVDEVKEDMPYDRMLYNEVNTQIGLTMKRKIYQFSAKYHDNYIVTEYTYINTGNIDGDEEIERPDVTLEDVIIHFQERLAICRQTRYLIGNSSGWGVNTMIDARGEPGRTDADNPDGLRFQFAWHGHYPAFTDYDNLGAPIFYPDGPGYIGDADTVGRLGSAQFTGVMTLHASKSSNEFDVDDKNQPSTTWYTSSDHPVSFGNSAWNASKMAEEYSWMAKGHPDKRHAELIEPSGDYAASKKDPSSGSSNGSGYSIANGYGPYTIEPGDSIKIVLVEAAAGLSREKCIEIGMQYKNDEISALQKNELVLTGKDSLFQSFERIADDYENNWEFPKPPLPPNNFTAFSRGGRVDLSWEIPNDASLKGFELYRNITGHVDGYLDHEYFSKYEKIADLDASVSTYQDTTLEILEDYYYYLVSVGDDVPANGELNIPAHTLKSNRLYTQTYQPVKAFSKGEPELSDKVRVVPNPFIISADDIKYSGEGNKNRITFVHLPGVCEIKIYTELGELVRTLEHNNGSGSEDWFLNTNSNQIIASGIYIAVISEESTGNQEIVKFVVIR